MTLGGQPYQIVARGIRRPAASTRDSVIGFTVNIAWGARPTFGHSVAGRADRDARQTSTRRPRRERDGGCGDANQSGTLLVRQFPLLFLDPSVSMVALGSTPAVRTWTIQTGQSNQSPLIGEAQGADEALLAAAAAALTLALGLVLAIRAVRAGVALTAMRSDFVSSVTHELKTPLANIRAMADTLARRPIGGETVRDYAALLMQEAKRLTRLVDNLLAYARVTDGTEIIRSSRLRRQSSSTTCCRTSIIRLSALEFTVEVDMPVDLPLVRADRPR